MSEKARDYPSPLSTLLRCLLSTKSNASLLRKGVSALVEREISSIRSAGLTCSDGCRAVQPQSLSVHEPGNHPNLESEVPKILGVKGMSHAGRADLEERSEEHTSELQ